MNCGYGMVVAEAFIASGAQAQIVSLEDLDWRLISEENRPGSVHMALEEVAAERAAEEDLGMVRTFRWAPSTLSLGYGQDPETVDWDYCERADVAVTRRQTGGGGIYHDHYADISYSIVVPAHAVSGDLLEAYHALCAPVLDFFKRLELDANFADEPQPALHEPACFLRDINPAHDILIDGAKISGNAQYRQRDAVIQHGSILFDRATDRHMAVFDTPGVSADTFRNRTTTVTECTDVSRSEAVDTLETALGAWAEREHDEWATWELEQARELAASKYGNSTWIFRNQ